MPSNDPKRLSWSRWFLRVALGYGLLPLVGCGLVALALSPPLVVRAALAPRFSIVQWSNATYSSNTRYRMLPDLISRHRLVGLTPDQAVLLLGPPTQREIGPKGWGWLVYYLRHNRGTFDSWYYPHLILRVEDGRIRRVEQSDPWIDWLEIVVRQG